MLKAVIARLPVQRLTLHNKRQKFTMATSSEAITLPDGRILCYEVYGSRPSRDSEKKSPTVSDRPSIFYFHGLPGSHHEARMFHEQAKSLNLQIVAISRPGFSESTFDPSRTILSFPKDVLALADHLDIVQFAVLGISGGGPYVLACLHEISPERLVGAAIASGMYPISLGTAGMPITTRVVLRLARWSVSLAGLIFDYVVGSVARDEVRPERYMNMVVDEFKKRPLKDQAVLFSDQGQVLDLLVKTTREAWRCGSQGVAWETRLFGSDWGFKLEDICVERGRLRVWHGSEDITIPIRMAEKAMSALRNAELKTCEEGHLSLTAAKAGEMLEFLDALL